MTETKTEKRFTVWVCDYCGDQAPPEGCLHDPEHAEEFVRKPVTPTRAVLIPQVEEVVAELERRANVDRPEEGAEGFEYASGRFHGFNAAADLLRSRLLGAEHEGGER